MFDNIGSTIKSLAKVTMWVGILFSIAIGIVLLNSWMLWGPLIIVIGGFASLLIASVLYGFGQLVENSDILVASFPNEESKSHAERVKPSPDPNNTSSKTELPWTCINCGTVNQVRTKCCQRCGVTRAWTHFQNE